MAEAVDQIALAQQRVHSNHLLARAAARLVAAKLAIRRAPAIQGTIVRNVQIALIEHWLLAIERIEIRSHARLPLIQSVLQSAIAAAVWHVREEHVEAGQAQRKADAAPPRTRRVVIALAPSVV